jgi:hypothetical protein
VDDFDFPLQLQYFLIGTPKPLREFLNISAALEGTQSSLMSLSTTV